MDSNVDLTVRLFTTPSGGMAFWEDFYSNVHPRNGQISVVLGRVGKKLPLASFNGTTYLELVVGSNAPMEPRQILTSVPYALSCASAQISSADVTDSFEVRNFDGVAAMHVRSNGNVGIRTTSPSQALTLGDGLNLQLGEAGDGGSLFFRRINSQIDPAVPVNGAGIYYNWDPGNSEQLVFNIAGSERVVVSGSGNVGIGTSSPKYTLEVNWTANCTSGLWSSSDERRKRDIATLAGSLDKADRLRGVSFEWRTEEYPGKGFSGGRQIGLVAQEVEKVVPELVNTSADGYKSVSYEKLTALLVEAVKEQQTQIDAQQTQIEAQQKRIDALEAMVARGPAGTSVSVSANEMPRP
jgi:hypothetical protein